MNKREIDVALCKIAQGDNVAFEQLYSETKGGVFAFLFSYFNNYADCEDAMQTVYLKIKQSASLYKPGTNGLAWILQIAKNTALNQLRSRAAAQRTSAATTTDEPAFEQDLALRSTLFVLMRKVLDEEENRIVVLHVVWQYKHREIAQQLNCPVGTVTSKYKRAIKKIKIALKEEQQ